MQNTRDLYDFGRRELQLAATLLRLFRSDKDHTLILGDKVTVEWNRVSGLVFLVDEDFAVAMVNGCVLEDWHRCSQCNAEGFLKDLTSPCCLALADIAA